MILNTHAHTDHSDGEHPASYVLNKAKEAGADSIVTTDHAEMLDKDNLAMRLFNYSLAPQNVLTWGKKVGFWPWFNDLHSLGMSKGLEIGLGQDRTSHILYLGGNDMIRANVLYRGCKEGNAFGFVYSASNLDYCEKRIGNIGPEEVAKKLKHIADSAGAVLIAAHPLSPKYPFTIGTEIVDAVEVFDPSQLCLNREWGLPVIKDLAKFAHGQKPLALVSGSDYHGQSTDKLGLQHENVFPSLRRHTIFPELSAQDVGNGYLIASHIRKRKCYAALGEARIKSMTVWPGGTFAPPDAKTPFRIEFTNAKGNLVNDIVFAFMKVGDTSVSTYTVKDKRRSSGAIQLSLHKLMPEAGCYIVYTLIKGQIATSAFLFVNTVPKPVVVAKPIPKDEDHGKSLGDALVDLASKILLPDSSSRPSARPKAPQPQTKTEPVSTVQGLPPLSPADQKAYPVKTKVYYDSIMVAPTNYPTTFHVNASQTKGLLRILFPGYPIIIQRIDLTPPPNNFGKFWRYQINTSDPPLFRMYSCGAMYSCYSLTAGWTCSRPVSAKGEYQGGSILFSTDLVYAEDLHGWNSSGFYNILTFQW